MKVMLATAVACFLCAACATSGTNHAQHQGAAPPPASEPTHTHHAIDYVEFSVTDIVASKEFYGTVFGWQFNDYGPDYVGIQAKNGGEVGGFRQVATVQTGGPLVVIFSNDLEATLSRVREAGGQINKEPFSFPGGRRFEFTDPNGNQLAVWSEK